MSDFSKAAAGGPRQSKKPRSSSGFNVEHEEHVHLMGLPAKLN
jgi:hypothetical protein